MKDGFSFNNFTVIRIGINSSMIDEKTTARPDATDEPNAQLENTKGLSKKDKDKIKHL